MTTLHVDCSSCRVRGDACTDCVVSVLLGVPSSDVRLTEAEQQAIDALSAVGLVPPLRLVRPVAPAGEEEQRRRGA